MDSRRDLLRPVTVLSRSEARSAEYSLLLKKRSQLVAEFKGGTNLNEVHEERTLLGVTLEPGGLLSPANFQTGTERKKPSRAIDPAVALKIADGARIPVHGDQLCGGCGATFGAEHDRCPRCDAGHMSIGPQETRDWWLRLGWKQQVRFYVDRQRSAAEGGIVMHPSDGWTMPPWDPIP